MNRGGTGSRSIGTSESGDSRRRTSSATRSRSSRIGSATISFKTLGSGSVACRLYSSRAPRARSRIRAASARKLGVFEQFLDVAHPVGPLAEPIAGDRPRDRRGPGVFRGHPLEQPLDAAGAAPPPPFEEPACRCPPCGDCRHRVGPLALARLLALALLSLPLSLLSLALPLAGLLTLDPAGLDPVGLLSLLTLALTLLLTLALLTCWP